MNVVVRDFLESDRPFIFSSWRNSSFFGVPHGTRPEAAGFFARKTREIGQILARNARVRIACLEDDPQLIIGYSVSTARHLEWIYVKDGFRKQGIGQLLFPKDTETVSAHMTKIGAAIAKAKNLLTPTPSVQEEKGELTNG